MEIYFPWDHEEHLASYPAEASTTDGADPDGEALRAAVDLVGTDPARAAEVADGLEILATATGKSPREIVEAIGED